MKIRIKGNTLRLRLTKNEVKRLATQGIVKEQIQFGPMARLVYALVQSEDTTINATFADNKISILIPNDIASNWVTTDQVSIKHQIILDVENTLEILIEKDFQCLDVRPGEDESDNFPNPNAKRIHS